MISQPVLAEIISKQDLGILIKCRDIVCQASNKQFLVLLQIEEGGNGCSSHGINAKIDGLQAV